MWKPRQGLHSTTRYDFKIECNGKCRNIAIIESNTSGDVDLYGREDSTPDLPGCGSCTCSSRKAGTSDVCSVSKTSGNSFFFTVEVYEAHGDLTVTVTCENLSNVECVGDQCGGDIGIFTK